MMNKLLTFPLTQDIEYCPISINNSVLKYNASMKGLPTIGQNHFDFICQSIKDEKDYILDFSNYNGGIDQNPIMLSTLANNHNVVVLSEEKLKDAFLNSGIGFYKEIGNIQGEKIYLTYFEENAQVISFIESLSLNNKGNIIDYFHRYVLTDFFMKDIEGNPIYSFEKGSLKYLESSNVYVNKYINVKSLFVDYKYVALIINDLKKLIDEHFQEINELVFLGVSNNGIILANLLAFEYQKEVQGLNRLGPIYCLDKENKKYDQFYNKKYLLISDVICMGGEYKMAKGIIDMLGGELVGGVSVVKIRDVYRNKKGSEKNRVYSLLEDINEIEIGGKIIDYKVFIDDCEE